jgi:hypothetical protein
MYMSELRHYGVVGMKWGVRRANRKAARRGKLEQKAANYELRSAKSSAAGQKIHARELEKKAAGKIKIFEKYKVKSAKATAKAAEQTDSLKRIKYESKAAKMNLKAARVDKKVNQIKRSTAYGSEAQKQMRKADKYDYKAKKTRYKIAKDKRYIAAMDKKVSDFAKKDYENGKKFIEMLSNR